MANGHHHQTDVVIVGAGPVGLFTVFECGMVRLHCHVVDVLDDAGGQCTALYPEKPIYDIPGFPRIEAAELVVRLKAQAAAFRPVYHLGEQVQALEALTGGFWRGTTSKGTVVQARAGILAPGLGAFGPKRPPPAGIQADALLPFFGLSMSLGPIADWSLALQHNQVAIDASTTATSKPGIFAIGDVVTYPGKLKLILPGFAEAAIAARSAYALVHPETPLHFEYSTTAGVPGA